MADVADDVAVMYGARIVEQASTEVIYNHPEMPYTLGLLSSIPRMDKEVTGRLEPIRGNPPSPIRLPLAACSNRAVRYSDLTGGLSQTVRPELLPTGAGENHLVRCHLTPEQRQQISRDILPNCGAVGMSPRQIGRCLSSRARRELAAGRPARYGSRPEDLLSGRSRGLLPRTVGQVKAVDGVNLDIPPGQTLGLVGESGSGKTTTSRSILMLVQPTDGPSIDDQEITGLSTKQLMPVRRKTAMIFQDPTTRSTRATP